MHLYSLGFNTAMMLRDVFRNNTNLMFQQERDTEECFYYPKQETDLSANLCVIQCRHLQPVILNRVVRLHTVSWLVCIYVQTALNYCRLNFHDSIKLNISNYSRKITKQYEVDVVKVNKHSHNDHF